MVAYGGNKFVEGFSGLTQGDLSKTDVKKGATESKGKSFYCREEIMKISRNNMPPFMAHYR